MEFGPRLRVALLLFGFSLSFTASPPEDQAASPPQDHWIGAWACSPMLSDEKILASAPGFTDATLRQIVHVSVGGERLRIRLSNAFGTQPLTITAVHVAASSGGSKIDVKTDKPVTFSGAASVTIPAGAPIVSDPLEFSVAPLSNVAISMRVGSMAEVTGHPGSRQTSYVEPGDALSAEEFRQPVQAAHWYFVNGLDVSGTRSSASIVAFGDSITDGHGATTDGDDRWPDDLARRLHADKKTSTIGVLNEGIGGNRLLHDGAGPNALARFDRDVLSQSGAHWLIVLEGINDIGAEAKNPVPMLAESIIAAYQQFIERAHSHGIRVYGATILPYGGAGYFSDAGEADRQKVNTWIRTSGNFDAVIDWDAVMRDPQQPSRMAASGDSGDHLHPSAAGYQKMAEAIDLKLFKTR